MFTPNEIQKLLKTINIEHILFIATQIGIDVLSDEEILLLQDLGFDLSELAITPFEEMFRWGLLSISIGDKKSKQVKYDDFLKSISGNNYLPLTRVENNAILNAKKQACSDLKGLGNKICQKTSQLLIEADMQQRANYEKIITDETVLNIANRGSIKNLVSNLGHATGDWARDFGRISDYVMTQAYEDGRATEIGRLYGEDALVYKRVFQSACKTCVKLYTTEGYGSKPKVFKLSELRKNGTNIGRKVDDWLPVISPTHPWCRCMLDYVDENYDWSPEEQSFNKPKTFERKIERKSKVTISIGNTTITV